MSDRRDPVEEASDGSRDLYDVATWEPRTTLDWLSIRVHGGVIKAAHGLVLIAALAILVVQFLFTGLAAIRNPVIGAFVLLSVVPALLLFVYVWRADATKNEPLGLLVGTFLLGILFASFAAVLNGVFQPLLAPIPLVGMALFFYLVVGPVEETVKWLAVRLYAYRSESFDAVIDGAVYGAAAGLGFATIENFLYIGQQYISALEAAGTTSPVFAALPTATVRTFAGPGHVIYSAFAGYYLGLAKFNPENRGPIIVKGLLIAAFVHATYNTTVGIGSGLIATLLDVPPLVGFLGYILVYDTFWGLYLLRKVRRYTTTLHRLRDASATTDPADIER
jgi:RsiW-degrading membrane proteinase PrsW (M82 family)